MSVSPTSSRTLELRVFHLCLSHSTLSTISEHLTINTNAETGLQEHSKLNIFKIYRN